ncbi:hypothetical protein TNIN_462201 [Trichonephila inaurata madagascariensis]|uniref:Uncharacterized protein n=1 Tax=Trichonephila inaurata madagascariensis TaxID=2747483 RepID=A0A8X6YSR1_9ARAC|nr:hypothetical protein TNIN_462201 [Trichonephila inaurata madagascariensis]
MYLGVITVCSLVAVVKRGYGVKKWDCFRMLSCSLVDSMDDYREHPLEDFPKVTNPVQETEQRSVESQSPILEENVTEPRPEKQSSRTVVADVEVHRPDTDSPFPLSPSISLPSTSSSRHSDLQQSVSGFTAAPSSMTLPSTGSEESSRIAEISDDQQIQSKELCKQKD